MKTLVFIFIVYVHYNFVNYIGEFTNGIIMDKKYKK